MINLDYLPDEVVRSALEREVESLEELLEDKLDPHEEFDKGVLLAVIKARLIQSS